MVTQLEELYTEVSEVFTMICGLDSNIENISEAIKCIKLSKFWITSIMVRHDKDFKIDYSYTDKHEDKMLTFLLLIKEKMDVIINTSNTLKNNQGDPNITDYFRNYWDNLMDAYYFIDAQIIIFTKIKSDSELV